MRKKILLLTAIVFTVGLAAVNAMMNTTEQQSENSSLDSFMMTMDADPEYPHYGHYRMDTHDCSTTITASIPGQICMYGICVDTSIGVDYYFDCENCAWNCDTGGANNTCDPVTCLDAE
ncbi:MAG: hypothetical protein WDZ29_05525 [Balneolaceae bacterium]